MSKPKLNATIRELRETLGLTQPAFAKKLNASVSSVSHYEIGARRPDSYTLAKLVGIAAKAKQWGIAKELAESLPGVKEGLLKPAWGEIVTVAVVTEE